MKNKKLILGGASIFLVLFVLFLVYLVPWADITNGKGLCFGRGCRVSGGQSMLQFSTVYCEGYTGYLEFGYGGLVCFPNTGIYCKYTHPFTSKDACLCEAEKRRNIDAFIRYCSKDKKCHNNQWGYEFGCTVDVNSVCLEKEKYFAETLSCCDYSNPSIKRCYECNTSWIQRYASAGISERVSMFKYAQFSTGSSIYSDQIYLEGLCSLICSNCNSSLCVDGSVCEFSVLPVCEKSERFLLPQQELYNNSNISGRFDLYEQNRDGCIFLCSNCSSSLCGEEGLCEYVNKSYNRVDLDLWLMDEDSSDSIYMSYNADSRRYRRDIDLLFVSPKGETRTIKYTACGLTNYEKFDNEARRWFKGIECTYTTRFMDKGTYNVSLMLGGRIERENIAIINLSGNQQVINKIIKLGKEKANKNVLPEEVSDTKQICSGQVFISKVTTSRVLDLSLNYVDSPVELAGNISGHFQVVNQDESMSVELDLFGDDLDLFLVSPSGEQIGFTNFTSYAEITPNIKYFGIMDLGETFIIQRPTPGTWTYIIYFKNASKECVGGGLYSLHISMEGDYKPDVSVGVASANASMFETPSIPVTIKNNGSGRANKISLFISSKDLLFWQEINITKLDAGESINTEVTLPMTSSGNIKLVAVANYSDDDGVIYYSTNSTIIPVSITPQAQPQRSKDRTTTDFNILFYIITNFLLPKINVNTTLDLSNVVATVEGMPNSIVDSYETSKGWSIFIDEKKYKGGIEIRCVKGDLDCDGVINETDYEEFRRIYSTTCDNENYSLLADFNENCLIDANDSVKFLEKYKGKKWFS